MKFPTSPCFRCVALGVLLLFAAACADAPVPVDPSYASEIEEWRSQRLAELTADDGWLTVTGLYWLEPGENRFGSAADNAVVLPDDSAAEIAGLLIVAPDGSVIAFGEEGAGVEINGEPLTTATLTTDVQGEPDIITAGRVRFHIIDRNGRLGARVKDPEANSRLTFDGIEHFDIDPAFRVEARFEPYDEARQVPIATVLGTDTMMRAFGLLHFAIGGHEVTLEPYMGSADSESMFLIFSDATSGDTTYGAGRFMSAAAPGDDGTTVLDFNFAYNPPCAFTPHATCPLPPPQNVLDVAITAGEKYSGDVH